MSPGLRQTQENSNGGFKYSTNSHPARPAHPAGFPFRMKQIKRPPPSPENKTKWRTAFCFGEHVKRYCPTADMDSFTSKSVFQAPPDSLHVQTTNSPFLLTSLPHMLPVQKKVDNDALFSSPPNAAAHPDAPCSRRRSRHSRPVRSEDNPSGSSPEPWTFARKCWAPFWNVAGPKHK